MDYWAQPRIDREQVPMFAPTLGEMVCDDHTVRMFDEILAIVDWRQWEAEYPRERGRPPIHPRVMAATIIPMLDRLESEFGGLPPRMFFDGAYGAGQNLRAFELRQIEAFTPITSSAVSNDTADESTVSPPAPADQGDDLPVNAGTQKLDRNAFVYDERAACYHCPTGQRLTYEKTTSKRRVNVWLGA